MQQDVEFGVLQIVETTEIVIEVMMGMESSYSAWKRAIS
jgi:hypothetical protein